MLLASDAASSSNNLSLLPNGTFIVELLIFIIVLGVMAKFILPPLQKAMDERERTIRAGVDAGEQGNVEAQQLGEQRRAVLDEARARAREALDAAAEEAESLREAHDLFQPPDGIVVPRVYQDYSTHRVLTMEFIRGLHLPEFLATDPPQGLRDRFGTKMYVAWKRIYDAHMNYADPSSGNYLFMNDGRLGLLDFGCVQHFDAGERELIQLSLALLDSLDTLRQFLRRAAGATDSDLENPEYIELMTEATKWTLEPAAAEGPFDFGSDEHLRDGLSRFSALARKGYARSHPMWLYFHRSVFGLRAVLYRLRARVDVRAVFAVR